MSQRQTTTAPSVDYARRPGRGGATPTPGGDDDPSHVQMLMRAGGNQAMVQLNAERGGGRGPATERAAQRDGDGAAPVAAATDVVQPASPMPSVPVIFEQIAHNFVYNGVTDQDRVTLQSWGYDAVAGPGMVQGTHGLVMLGLASYRAGGVSRSPVLAFQGTNSLEGVYTDGDPTSVGHVQFTRNRALITRTLQRLAAGGAVMVTGHSLGGAMAQIVACEMPGQVRGVQTFQAPGINRERLNQLSQEDQARIGANSTHHVAANDVVHRVGDGHTPGQVLEYQTEGGAVGLAGAAGRLLGGPLGEALVGGGARAAAAHRAMLVSEIEGVPEGGRGSAEGAARGRGRGRRISDPSNGALEAARGTLLAGATRAMGSNDEAAHDRARRARELMQRVERRRERDARRGPGPERF